MFETNVIFKDSEVRLFSKASGDFNPIHLDEVFASRTQYRKPVVFAIQIFLTTICRVFKQPINLKTLDIKFIAPIFVGDNIRVLVEKMSGNCSLTLKSGNRRLLKTNFSFTSEREESDSIRYVDDYRDVRPPDRKIEELEVGEEITEEVGFARSAGRVLFPSGSAINDAQIAILLSCSRALAARLLGQNWVLVGMNIDFSVITENCELDYKIYRISHGTGMAVIAVLNQEGVIAGKIVSRVLDRGDSTQKLNTHRESTALDLTMNGETALVTGSSRGIGEAVSRILASQGVNLICHCAHNIELLDSLKIDLEKRYGVNVSTIVSDLSTKGSSRKLVSDALALSKNIDYLVHCAFPGVMATDIFEVNEEDIQEQLTFSMFSILEFIQELVTYDHPCVVLGLSSIFVKTRNKKMLPYILGKNAMEAFYWNTKSELLKKNIIFKIVRPSQVNTDLHVGSVGSKMQVYIDPVVLAKKIVEFLADNTDDMILEVTDNG